MAVSSDLQKLVHIIYSIFAYFLLVFTFIELSILTRNYKFKVVMTRRPIFHNMLSYFIRLSELEIRDQTTID